jgi:hypothetical protein
MLAEVTWVRPISLQSGVWQCLPLYTQFTWIPWIQKVSHLLPLHLSQFLINSFRTDHPADRAKVIQGPEISRLVFSSSRLHQLRLSQRYRLL